MFCWYCIAILLLPRPHHSQCHGWQIWFSPARAPWMSYLCSAFVSSCFMMPLTSQPQAKKKRRVRVRSSVPRNARWIVSGDHFCYLLSVHPRSDFTGTANFSLHRDNRNKGSCLDGCKTCCWVPKQMSRQPARCLTISYDAWVPPRWPHGSWPWRWAKWKSWLGFVRSCGQSPRFSWVQSQRSDIVSCHPSSVTCLNLQTPIKYTSTPCRSEAFFV